MRMNLIRLRVVCRNPMVAFFPDRHPLRPELPDMPYGCKIKAKVGSAVMAPVMASATCSGIPEMMVMNEIQAAMTMTPGRNRDITQEKWFIKK